MCVCMCVYVCVFVCMCVQARMRASTCASMHAGALFWGCVQLPFVQICMSMRLCMHSLVQEGKCTWVWMWVWVYVAAPECHAKRTCSALPSRRLGDGLVFYVWVAVFVVFVTS
mmetsp:Transcript_27102/g.73254  ORF Transcript_27102/g.73254 Transcript_27102/m.73254 type:complete len:113 (+) Transcript_27102:366-704(+)